MTVGSLTFSIMAGSLDADDISISDDPKYSSLPFIQARKLNVGVELLPIVFGHQFAHHKIEYRYTLHPTHSKCNGKVEFL